jgi:hypothetical protein
MMGQRERESFSYPGILSTWNSIDSRRSKNTSSTNDTGVPFPYICGFTAIFPPTNAKKEKIDQQPNFLSKEYKFDSKVSRSLLRLKFHSPFQLKGFNPLSLSRTQCLQRWSTSCAPKGREQRAVQNTWACHVEPSQVDCATWIYWIMIHWACKITFVPNSLKGTIVALALKP